MKDVKVLLGGALLLAGGVWFGLKPLLFGPEPPLQSYSDAELAEAPRPTLRLEERVLNLLSDQSGEHYVKLMMVLEFEDPELEYVGLAGEPLVAANESFAMDITSSKHRIWSVITDVFGATTKEELADPDARFALKELLAAEISRQIPTHEVENVYFEGLVIQ